MRKVFLGMAAVAFMFTACNNDSAGVVQDEQSKIDMSDFYVYTDGDLDEAARQGQGKSCYTMANLNRLLNENPGLEQKMYNIEYHTRSFIAAKKPDGTPGGGGNGGDGGDGGGGTDPVDDGLGTITIPVFFHVVLPNADDVTDQQINAQIDILNEDFSAANGDINLVPDEFAGVVANSNIQFTLAGIIRVNNPTSSWGTNDAVKFASPVVNPQNSLNIWACNLGSGLLGYAQFPGGPSSTDGVVILHESMPGGNAAPYNGGRTLTHEVGHYLNLRHIWGDGGCSADDFVADTPLAGGPNYGCPSYPTNSCRPRGRNVDDGNDMTMNYMDYTYDECMYMFSEGQKERMRALFAPGGARDAFIP